MSPTLTRRSLLRGLRSGADPIRPPWSRAEAEFVDLCSRCDDCIDACPQGVLRRGDGGFPQLDVSRAGCTFCGRCADACEEGAFATPRGEPWSVAAAVAQNCVESRGVSCRLCEGWCESDAIRFRPLAGGRATVIVEQGACTGCGACVAPCPVGAISLVRSPAHLPATLVAGHEVRP